MGSLEDFLRMARRDGDLESKGSFTWNLDRAMDVLSQYQLADKSEYILRVIASAVASGASDFQLETLPDGYRFSWSGQGLEWTELQQLFPSVLGGPPKLAELAIGLGAARSLFPSIELQATGGTLSMTGADLTISTVPSLSSRTTLQLRRPRWKHLAGGILGRKELSVIARRCALAPLELTVPFAVPPLEIAAGTRVIQFGNPHRPLPRDKILLRRDSADGLGSGYLILDLDAGPSMVQVLGVSYPLPAEFAGPPFRLLWWNDTLALDVGRSGLVRGAELEGWWEELTRQLEQGLRSALQEQPSLPFLRPALEWFLAGDADMDDLPLFRWGDGNPATLGALRARFQQQGYLATAREIWMEDNGLDPSRILLLDENANAGLHLRLPHMIAVDHLREWPSIPRLPGHRSYVARLPGIFFRGEMGLRTDRLPYLDILLDGTRSERRLVPPFGIDAAMLPGEELKTAPVTVLRVLHHLEVLDDEDRTRHVLGHLTQMAMLLFPQGTRGIPLAELLPKVQAGTLQELLQRVQLTRTDGGKVALLDLLPHGEAEVESLTLDPLSRQLLLYLLRPSSNGRIWIPFNACCGLRYGPLTEVASEAAAGAGGLTALKRFLGRPECSAFKALRHVLGDLQILRERLDALSPEQLVSPRPTLPQTLQGPCLWALRRSLIVSSEMIVLGILQDESRAADLLRELGVTSDLLMNAFEKLSLRGDEAMVELSLLLEECRVPKARAELLAARSLLHTGWGDYGTALSEAKMAHELDPTLNHQLALCKCLAGDLEGSLPDYERALEMFPGKFDYYCDYAEALAKLGREEEAGRALARSFELEPNAHAPLGVKARLLRRTEPELALECCNASLEGGSLSLDVWEIKASLLQAKGQLAEAAECLKQFVELSGFRTVREHDLDARVRAAKDALESLESRSV